MSVFSFIFFSTFLNNIKYIFSHNVYLVLLNLEGRVSGGVGGGGGGVRKYRTILRTRRVRLSIGTPSFVWYGFGRSLKALILYNIYLPRSQRRVCAVLGIVFVNISGLTRIHNACAN